MNAQSAETQWLTTTSALLAALREPDNQTIWLGFDARYRGVIERFARRLGLDADDATDIAQQTLAEFARDHRAGKYDPNRGRLSAWIIGIARNRAIDLLRSRGRRRGHRGSSALLDVPDAELTRIWEQERDQTILDQALGELARRSRMNQRTLRVFERVAIHGDAPANVAEVHGLSVDEVYRVKNRVTKQLRAIVARLEREYE
jgi:RNA polymerase sigma-70 factor (ECF subfamily)